jgi:hypothetical protein
MAANGLQWETIDGLQVLRVWQIEGDAVEPHVVLVKVTPQRSQTYLNDPTQLLAFVNNNSLFPAPVLQVASISSLSFGTGASYPQYLYVLSHSLRSTMSVTVQNTLTYVPQ